MISDRTSEPWGYYSPTKTERRVIDLCRKMPRNRLGRRLAVIMRRRVKHGSDTPLDVLVWGLRMRLCRRGNYSETALLFTPQFFDEQELGFLKDRVYEGFQFLDLGANAGAYSFWIYSLLGHQCSIVAVEPDPEIYARLVFNISANNAFCVHPLNLGLDDHNGMRTLFINPQKRGQNSLLGIPDSRSSIQTELVEVRTLPQILEDENINRIDAMKIDLEGMEYPVLRYFFNNVGRALYPMLILTEFKRTADHTLLKDMLGELGYTVVKQTKENLILELMRTP